MGRNLFTFDSLTDKVVADFSWRRKELTLIKNKIPKEKNSLQSALIRATIPLLYAHWEGFVKVNMSYYLEYVSNKYLKNRELKTSFIALSLQNKLGDLSNSSFSNRTKIIDFIFEDLEKQSKIPKKNIINTKSNLSFNVLQEILFILDLEDSHVDSQKELINDLVNERNYIAHGEHTLIDYETFENFYYDIISLMEYLRTIIENNAIQEKYKKPAANTVYA
ncbi:hypothetical protein HNV08_05985 [Winogradskyella eckloniae]|uniref:MAE_28990/MAE_18760 family HEPN-like nuclease n=1 Tax=Winogradskyella eckloniae TaxID=1089306 RepID=UPI0015641DDD|nr:MAE_28990/MAE_18760 family HEPN-like nuclease [Winogradskyella eckloniae]NRD19589.1 hypothetical protein [Winogradskyella eckloniae]